MNITLLGFVLGLLLLAIPAYALWVFDRNMLSRLAKSVVRYAIVVAVLSAVLWCAVKAGSAWLSIVLSLLLVVLGAALTIGRARLKSWRMFVPTLLGMLAATVLTGAYVLLLCLNNYALILPVAGLLVGCMTGMNARALNAYFMGLQHHNQLYYFLLGNGATHREAVRHFVGRALRASMVGAARQMTAVGFATAPVALYVLVMAGVGVGTAAATQILLVAWALAAATISQLITFAIARRWAFDDYERLKSPESKSGDTALHVEQPSVEQRPSEAIDVEGL